ncbi:hypothetical protein TREES_T100018689 [Tupaia chinensis]|uniref:Uncharacterized protein n=1 Tax=Tupaia chinensis TaxID=246437 RepID=L9KN24_TUPCH|nr:hypothetical protein TREES_T100018689 [Tupaia chinensis]
MWRARKPQSPAFGERRELKPSVAQAPLGPERSQSPSSEQRRGAGGRTIQSRAAAQFGVRSPNPRWRVYMDLMDVAWGEAVGRQDGSLVEQEPERKKIEGSAERKKDRTVSGWGLKPEPGAHEPRGFSGRPGLATSLRNTLANV